MERLMPSVVPPALLMPEDLRARLISSLSDAGPEGVPAGHGPWAWQADGFHWPVEGPVDRGRTVAESLADTERQAEPDTERVAQPEAQPGQPAPDHPRRRRPGRGVPERAGCAATQTRIGVVVTASSSVTGTATWRSAPGAVRTTKLSGANGSLTATIGPFGESGTTVVTVRALDEGGNAAAGKTTVTVRPCVRAPIPVGCG